jgi:hypothetical protein
MSIFRRYTASITAGMFAFAALIGIPIKTYIEHTHDHVCLDAPKPTFWTKQMAKTYARGYIKIYHPTWGRGEWKALASLWGKESAWDHTADNPTSTAYGIAQVLGTKPGTPAPLQIEKGLEYIVHRYDKPSVAWSHWRKHGWY